MLSVPAAMPAELSPYPSTFVPGDFVMNRDSARRYSTRFLFGAFAMAVMLSAPLTWAQGQKVLKFVPQADLRILDPITTTAYITRNTAQFILPTAYRTNLSGVIIAPITLMWNVEKK
jgi:hypothetical protein